MRLSLAGLALLVSVPLQQLWSAYGPSAFAASSATTFWTDSDVPKVPSSANTQAAELGMSWTSDVNGYAHGVRFYKGAGNVGTHVGNLWSDTGQRLATVTFTNETAEGWQTALFGSPVAVVAGQSYVISYHTDSGHYADDEWYFLQRQDAPPLHADAKKNGLISTGPSAFPTRSWHRANYWVDVVFSTSATLGTDASLSPTATSPSPSPSPTSTTSSPSPSPTSTTTSPSPTSTTISPSPSPTSTTTSPSPSPTGTTTGTSQLSGGRDKTLWPFSSSSFWNMPIGSGAQYVGARFASPDYYSVDEDVISMTPSAPMRAVYTNGKWPASCDTTTLTSVSVPVPDSFVVTLSSSHGGSQPNFAGAFLAPDGRTVVQGQATMRCTAGGPVTMYGLRKSEDIYGSGYGAFGGHGGSGLSSLGGTIRLGELTSPDPIRHALKLTIDCRKYCSDGNGGYRWPALAADSYYKGFYGSLSPGGLPGLGMGSLLALPPSVDISTLGLETAAAKKLAWTLQNYGAYVADDSYNPGSFDAQRLDIQVGVWSEMKAIGIRMDTPSGTPWYRDMDRIWTKLALVSNNGSSSIGGGGTPLQPLAPPIGN